MHTFVVYFAYTADCCGEAHAFGDLVTAKDEGEVFQAVDELARMLSRVR